MDRLRGMQRVGAVYKESEEVPCGCVLRRHDW